jgi:2-polyprenyl-3-methyl-5-hydroxy-6-metoxy-1,4-benzoquinol methylase
MEKWDTVYSEKNKHFIRKRESKFADEFINYIKKDSKILEIGCGLGHDALFLKNEGFNVTGLDVSKVALKELKDKGLFNK